MHDPMRVKVTELAGDLDGEVQRSFDVHRLVEVTERMARGSLPGPARAAAIVVRSSGAERSSDQGWRRSRLLSRRRSA